MTAWIISGALGFGSGAAVVWFFKESIQGLVIDANTLSTKLRAKADAISRAANEF